jgi:hypothetical protein
MGWTRTHFCLIHTLIDNNAINRAYLEQFDIPSDRMTVKTCNTPESKAVPVWAMMSEKWNNSLFSLLPVLMEGVHSTCDHPILIDHDVVSDLAIATLEGVKAKWPGLPRELKR